MVSNKVTISPPRLQEQQRKDFLSVRGLSVKSVQTGVRPSNSGGANLSGCLLLGSGGCLAWVPALPS